MLKGFLKIISTMLVLVMCIQMVPAQALGEVQTVEPGKIVESKPILSVSSSKDAAVVAELTEGRTAYTKEFLLSNGLHMATVYAEPIHYIKDGKWVPPVTRPS